MGGGFVLLFWLIVFGAFAATWMAAFGVYCFRRDKGPKTLKWLSGTPLAVLTLIGVGCIGFVGIGLIRSMNPNYVFELQFHQPPPADVTHLRSSYWSFADSGQVFLTFQTSPESFRQILPRNVRHVKFSESLREMPNSSDEPPSWWHPPTAATSEIYFVNSIEGMGQTFSNETTLITFEATTGTVMYCFLGID